MLFEKILVKQMRLLKKDAVFLAQVLTLTKPELRIIGGKPTEDEQLHVLPLYKLDLENEDGTFEGVRAKLDSGAIEVCERVERLVPGYIILLLFCFRHQKCLQSLRRNVLQSEEFSDKNDIFVRKRLALFLISR